MINLPVAIIKSYMFRIFSQWAPSRSWDISRRILLGSWPCFCWCLLMSPSAISFLFQTFLGLLFQISPYNAIRYSKKSIKRIPFRKDKNNKHANGPRRTATPSSLSVSISKKVHLKLGFLLPWSRTSQISELRYAILSWKTSIDFLWCNANCCEWIPSGCCWFFIWLEVLKMCGRLWVSGLSSGSCCLGFWGQGFSWNLWISWFAVGFLEIWVSGVDYLWKFWFLSRKLWSFVDLSGPWPFCKNSENKGFSWKFMDFLVCCWFSGNLGFLVLIICGSFSFKVGTFVVLRIFQGLAVL